jgi:hypothetical protein
MRGAVIFREESNVTRIIRSVPAMLAVLLILGAAVAQKTTQADLEKQAKITKEEATKTALARVPGGTVKESELEKEKGKLVWSFDIATANTKDITEVQVDAVSGKIVSVEKETPKSEAKEKKAESKPAKQ